MTLKKQVMVSGAVAVITALLTLVFVGDRNAISFGIIFGFICFILLYGLTKSSAFSAVSTQLVHRQMLQTKKLYDAGILTQAEYDTKIQKLKRKVSV